jgi:hypothetical protein
MHTQCDGQLYIRSAAGACDKDQVVAIFGFSKDLVHIWAQHFGADNCQMDSREQRDSARFFSRGAQNDSPRFGKEIVGLSDAQVTKRHFMFIGIRGGFPWRRVPRAEGEGSYAGWGRFASDATARERSEWRRRMGLLGGVPDHDSVGWYQNLQVE